MQISICMIFRADILTSHSYTAIPSTQDSVKVVESLKTIVLLYEYKVQTDDARDNTKTDLSNSHFDN